jgi:formylglycine-generating enzyme required for sulfatase activity
LRGHLWKKARIMRVAEILSRMGLRLLIGVLLFGAACENMEQSRTPPGPQDMSTPSQCPSDMVEIESFCIDRYESAIKEHSPFHVPTGGEPVNGFEQMPQGYISGTVAASVCESGEKRLCSSEEWLRACQGPEETLYPYGNTYQASACNDSRSAHPIHTFFGDDPDRWLPEAMNDPGINQQTDTVDLSGQNAECVSADGVYDLHGNLHEWVSDSDGIFRGGFYADARINGEGCMYRTTAHGFGYHDYSTGFRCCANLP